LSNNPLVSVVLPTYNGFSRGFRAYAIESVLNQTYKNLELLIVDDGSKDDTSAFCQKYLDILYLDTRIKYIHQQNKGVSTARNNGIKNSIGKYIAFIDDDDIWLENKLSEQVDFVEKICDKKFGLCYTSLAFIDASGDKTGTFRSNNAAGYVFEELLQKNIVNCTSSVLVSSAVFEDVGYFKESMSHAEDYDLWLRISRKYNVYSLNKPLVLYREHANNVSANLDKIEAGAIQAVMRILDGDQTINKNFILNQVYRNRAAYRFWLGNYDKFRGHIRTAKKYGTIDLTTRVRFLFSYFPRVVKFVKKIGTFCRLS
jgi:glycosyltransferase involved in cell wall biosynthesis